MNVQNRLKGQLMGAVGICVTLVVGLVASAPTASADVEPTTMKFVMFSQPRAEEVQLALSTGARQPRNFYGPLGRLPLLVHNATFRPTFKPQSGLTFAGVGLTILQCPNTMEVSNCTPIAVTDLNRRFVDTILYSDDFSINLGDATYGKIIRGQFFPYGPGVNENRYVTDPYFSVMRQPKAAGRPQLRNGSGDDSNLDIANTDRYTMSAFAWDNLPRTNTVPTRTFSIYACDNPDAGQVATFNWDSNGCEEIVELKSELTVRADFGPMSLNLNLDQFAEHVGRYLLFEEKLSYSSLIDGGVTVAVRSATYPIVNSAVAQQAGQGNQQAGQGNQQAGQGNQQAGQGNQQAGQGNQQAGQEVEQSVVGSAPTGAAALRLNYSQAPLVSNNGVGSVDGTVLTVKAPTVQVRGKRKKTYRAIVDPKYRGRVAFVLTRTTPKGEMIVAKSKVKSATKNGTAKVRWQFSKKKPVGNYTLYVSFIPRPEYGKSGLTVSKPVSLR